MCIMLAVKDNVFTSYFADIVIVFAHFLYALDVREYIVCIKIPSRLIVTVFELSRLIFIR